jgi:hypothetical protein
MTSDEINKVEDTSVRVEIIPQTTSEMVEAEMVGESDDVKHETKALIEAIKKRAQVEAQSAGSFTRETYLNAVRQARETIERDRPLIERDRIEHSFELVKQEAEKNWESILKEVAELGDRLADAAKAAWEVLTAPRPRSH